MINTLENYHKHEASDLRFLIKKSLCKSKFKEKVIKLEPSNIDVTRGVTINNFVLFPSKLKLHLVDSSSYIVILDNSLFSTTN
jgi:hypothetical protein